MPARSLYFITFIGFTAVMAAKDVLSRYLLVQGVPVAHWLTFSGSFGLLFAFLVAVVTREPLRVQSYKYQGIRLVLDGISWALATQAFKLLNATSISIVAKAYIPFLILIGPLLGNHFSRTQKACAWAAMTTMVLFACVNRAPNEHIAGYVILLLCTIVVSVSYIMLRHSTLKESPFVVAATPALACVIVGSLWTWQSGVLYEPTASQFGWEIVCGFLIYALYTASIYRYRLLPMGLAEYPALLTVFLIMPAEYWLFGWVPGPLYLANILFALLLIGACVYLNLAQKKAVTTKT